MRGIAGRVRRLEAVKSPRRTVYLWGDDATAEAIAAVEAAGDRAVAIRWLDTEQRVPEPIR